MTLRPPTLDHRTFDELLDETRRRIARYTPEYAPAWDDHNESDPGITLLQLFVWLTQTTQEQVNKLPERAFRTLLDLVGIDRKPASSATVDLVFQPIPGVSRTIDVPRGVRVAGEANADDGTPVVFETTRDIEVTNCELALVLTYDGVELKDRTTQNEPDSDIIYPFGERPERGAATYFGFAKPSSPENTWQPFGQRIWLRAFAPRETTTVLPVKCGTPDRTAAARMACEYLPETGASWKPLTIFGDDETLALERPGYLEIEGPPKDINPAQVGQHPDLYWLRLRLTDDPNYGSRVPRVAFFRFNAVPALHRVTIRRELLGMSNGKPDQTFTTFHKPVVPDSLMIEVEDEEGSPKEWLQVPFFRDADPEENGSSVDTGRNAMVYRFDTTTGIVTFADGHRGLIPPAGRSVFAKQYQHGGGAAGNQDPGKIAALQSTLPGVAGVANPQRAVGGRDAEPIDDAIRRAPLRLQGQERVITAADYQRVAEEFGGVRRAEVRPLLHPDYPGINVPGAVTVLVVQDTDRIPPRPDDNLLRSVCRSLNAQRALATEVYVGSPRFLRIDVTAHLIVRPDKSTAAAKGAARKALDKFLDPTTWPFGRDLYPSNFYHELLELREVGIDAVEYLAIAVDGRRRDTEKNTPVRLDASSLVYSGSHTIQARLSVS